MAQSVTSSPLRLAGLLLCLPLLLLTAKCTARHPLATPKQLAEMQRADALVRDGCYRCLSEAYAIYAAQTNPNTHRLLAPAARGAFDTSLLMAVRQKELGLAADAALAQARGLLVTLAPKAPAPSQDDQPTPATLLEAAETIVGDTSGLDAEERQQQGNRLRRGDVARATEKIERLQQALRTTAAPNVTAAYLAVAIECERPGRRNPQDLAAMQAQAGDDGDSPLMRYRLALCTDDPRATLVHLLEADPRWVDTLFFEGKYELGTPARSPEPARAAALLASASEAFPESIGIRVLLAHAQQMNGDYAPALASYDAILAAKPAHVDARLGRLENLSYLGRTDEAIAMATMIIDAATWNVGDGYYWRAWNEYEAHRIEPAWADVQAALRMVANTAVYYLAGSIAYARKDPETAVRHFDSAYEIDQSNCAAVWSAGLVHVEQSAWPLAVDKFSKATTCFATAASTARAELTKVEQSSVDAAVKARRAASARKRIASAEDLGSQSALNAAAGLINIGQPRQALPYIDLAEKQPGTHDKALALRARIGGGGGG